MMQISLSNQKGGTEGSLLRYRIYLVPVFFFISRIKTTVQNLS